MSAFVFQTVCAAAPSRILLVCEEGGTRALCGRVANYLEANFEVPVVCVSEALNPEEKMVKPAEALHALMDAHDICVVAWQAQSEAEAFAETICKPQRVAVLNIDAEAWEREQDVDAKERFARLVEKHTTRAVALLLGLAECPWPHCALNDVPADVLGTMSWGRNLCPPCQQKARKILRERFEVVAGGWTVDCKE